MINLDFIAWPPGSDPSKGQMQSEHAVAMKAWVWD